MSVMLGRPRSINASDCNIRTPIDCNFPKDSSKTIPSAAGIDGEPSTYSAALFSYSLAHKVHEILAAGAQRPHIKDYSVVTNFHNQVISAINDLPPSIRLENPDCSWDTQFPNLPRQRHYVASSANAFLMALHRPHALIHIESRNAAIRAALNVLDAQEHLFGLMKIHQYRIYTLSFYTIDAGIFLAGISLESSGLGRDLEARIRSAITHSIARLKLMEERSPMAKSGVQILEICYEKIMERVRDESHDAHLDESSARNAVGIGAAIPEGKPLVPTQLNGNVDPQTTNGHHFEGQPGLQMPLNTGPPLPVQFGNVELDPSFWDEMNQMINFDVGVSMEESLWDTGFITENGESAVYNGSELF